MNIFKIVTLIYEATRQNESYAVTTKSCFADLYIPTLIDKKIAINVLKIDNMSAGNIFFTPSPVDKPCQDNENTQILVQ